MNTTQALARLRKVLGQKAAIRDAGRPSSPEIRQSQHAKRLLANERKRVALEAMAARRKAILDADDEYQRLKVAYTAALAEQERTPLGHTYRYTSGTAGSLFFTVVSEADSLAELVEKTEAKKVLA